MACAVIACMAILCIVALLAGCSSQSEGESKAAGAPSVASPLQAKGLLELDQSSIEEVLSGFGLAGFSFDTTDSTGGTPVTWGTFAFETSDYRLSDINPSLDVARVYVRYAKGAAPYGNTPDDVYDDAADLADGPAPSSVSLNVEFDLADDGEADNVLTGLFAAVSEGADELYTVNLAQQLADRNAELLEQMTDEEREQYYEALSSAGVEDIAGKTYESSWADEHWYRCQVDGRDALVRVSAVKIKGYGSDYDNLAASGGARYQLGGYCAYLDAVASRLGIESTYDAFVEYLKANGPVGL
jgi:hypothetical protein